MKNKNSVRSNFIYNSLYQLSGIMVPLVTMPYLSRVLEPEGLGEYSFAYSVAYYFTIFIKLGLNNYGNRSIAYVKDNKEELSRTFWEIYAFQFLSGIILFFVYLVYGFFIAPQTSLGIIMAILVFSSVIDVTWCIYGLEKFKITSIRDMATKILTMICVFVFVNSRADVWKYALIFSSGVLANQIVILPVLRREIEFIRISRKGVIKHIIPNAILFIPVVAISVYRFMDKIMLGIISEEAELGYYHGAENVIKVPMALVTALGTVMLPRMSNMISNGTERKVLESTFNKSIEFSMFITSAVCLGIMTVAGEFVPLFYGKGFETCIYIFYIILPGSIFEAFANVIRTQYLIPRKKDRIYILSLIMGATINFILNLILIPRYDSVGAAMGTVSAYAMVCIVQAVCVYKEANIGVNIVNSIPYVLSGIIMFAAMHGYSVEIKNVFLALLVKIIISGVLYLAVLMSLLVIRKRIRAKRNHFMGKTLK